MTSRWQSVIPLRESLGLTCACGMESVRLQERRTGSSQRMQASEFCKKGKAYGAEEGTRCSRASSKVCLQQGHYCNMERQSGICSKLGSLHHVKNSRDIAAAGWRISFVGGTFLEKAPGSLCRASSSEGSHDAGVASDDPQNSALKIEQLQVELDHAVRSEQYELAARLRDRLRILQEDDEAAVLAANALFYRAFAKADLRLMRRVWVNAEHVQCLHPGNNCISGYDLVMASWEAVLSSAREYRIDLEDVRVHTNGTMAVVTCVEVIRAAGGAGRIAATNIYEKQGNEWRICLHHGSQVPTSLFA